MLHALLIVATIGAVPQDLIVRDHVDIIEVNNYYQNGKPEDLLFSQMIFWDADFENVRFVVIDWRMCRRPAQIPTFDHARGFYSVSWYDKTTMTFRVVTAPEYRVTNTTYDPELENRAFFNVGKRRKLGLRSNWPTRGRRRYFDPIEPPGEPPE